MQLSHGTIDLILFLIANLVNLLIVGVMLSRPLGLKRLERGIGWVVAALGLPVGLAVVLNALGGRPWWAVVLPLLLLVHCLIELVVDCVLQLDFRRTRWVGPYLLVFYAAQMGMIGYSFLTFDRWGFVTLGTYFASLAATWYSYRRVGHGQ